MKRRFEIFSESEELLFYGVKLLFELNEYDEATIYLTRFLRRNSNCRSAWTFLARAIRDLDECLATACICRAMLLTENPVLIADAKVELILCLSSLNNFKGCHRFLQPNFYEEGAYLADEALELAVV